MVMAKHPHQGIAPMTMPEFTNEEYARLLQLQSELVTEQDGIIANQEKVIAMQQQAIIEKNGIILALQGSPAVMQ